MLIDLRYLNNFVYLNFELYIPKCQLMWQRSLPGCSVVGQLLEISLS